MDGSPIVDKVSIVMPVYNSEKWVSKTIESVKAQTYSNWELVAIDDCSTDRSLDILYKNNIFTLRHPKNMGPAAARNTGVNSVLGTLGVSYMVFLDSDDIVYPTFLEKMVDKMASQYDIGMLYAHVDRRFENGNEAFPYGFPDNPPVFDKALMFEHNYIYISCSMFRIDVVKDVGDFCSAMRALADWDYYCRVANAGYKIQCLPEKLGCYTVRSGSNASDCDDSTLRLLKERQNKDYRECR